MGALAEAPEVGNLPPPATQDAANNGSGDTDKETGVAEAAPGAGCALTKAPSWASDAGDVRCAGDTGVTGVGGTVSRPGGERSVRSVAATTASDGGAEWRF